VVMEADDLYFNDREVKEAYNKVVNILWNVVVFYQTYSSELNNQVSAKDSNNILDRWILAKLNLLVEEVTEGMDNYNTVKAGRPIKYFIDELSTWYLRRSRDRFKGEDESDKQFALATMCEILTTLSKIMAPFTPFIAEKIWYTVTGNKESVHLQMWPEVNKKLIDKNVLAEMTIVRKIVEMGLAARAEGGLKVRQPLQYIRYQGKRLSEELEKVVAEELNVKEVKYSTEVRDQEDGIVKEDSEIRIRLNTVVTPELKREGVLRELVRGINQLRKEKGLTPTDLAVVYWQTDDKELREVFSVFKAELGAFVKAKDLVFEVNAEAVELVVGEAKIMIALG